MGLNIKTLPHSKFNNMAGQYMPAWDKKEKKRITGEQTDTTIAVDGSENKMAIELPKPLIIGGIALGIIVIGAIIYRIVK